MWTIYRVDRFTNYTDFFGLQWVTRRRDLDVEGVRNGGFVGKDDEIIVVNPDGFVRASYVGREGKT